MGGGGIQGMPSGHSVLLQGETADAIAGYRGLQQPSCSHRCPAYSGLQGLLGAITHCGTTAPLSTVQASHSSALPILAPVRHRLLAIIPNNAITKLPSYLDISLVATLLRRYRLGRVWAGSWCCRLEQTLATSVALARLGPVPSLVLHLLIFVSILRTPYYTFNPFCSPSSLSSFCLSLAFSCSIFGVGFLTFNSAVSYTHLHRHHVTNFLLFFPYFFLLFSEPNLVDQ